MTRDLSSRATRGICFLSSPCAAEWGNQGRGIRKDKEKSKSPSEKPSPGASHSSVHCVSVTRQPRGRDDSRTEPLVHLKPELDFGRGRFSRQIKVTPARSFVLLGMAD